MTSDRKTAFAAGALFIATFITSIWAMLLYKPTIDASTTLLTSGAENRILFGGFLEMLLIVANIGTAVVLFPVLKRKSEFLSISFVTARLVESGFIAVGILSLLALVTVNQDLAGTDPAVLNVVGESLVAIHDWTFQLGPGWVVGLGNGLILGYVMFRYNLVPRGMAAFGLVGGPAILLSGTAVLFGVIEPGSGPQILATAPEFIWEASLGIYLMVKGFKTVRPESVRATESGPIGVPVAA